jgi:hypothetical protein
MKLAKRKLPADLEDQNAVALLPEDPEDMVRTLPHQRFAVLPLPHHASLQTPASSTPEPSPLSLAPDTNLPSSGTPTTSLSPATLSTATPAAKSSAKTTPPSRRRRSASTSISRSASSRPRSIPSRRSYAYRASSSPRTMSRPSVRTTPLRSSLTAPSPSSSPNLMAGTRSPPRRCARPSRTTRTAP